VPSPQGGGRPDCNHPASGPPSTMLRMVPLPRYHGGGSAAPSDYWLLPQKVLTNLGEEFEVGEGIGEQGLWRFARRHRVVEGAEFDAEGVFVEGADGFCFRRVELGRGDFEPGRQVADVGSVVVDAELLVQRQHVDAGVEAGDVVDDRL